MCILVVAQVHLRHLVGGRARSYTGEIPDEKIYQVGDGAGRVVTALLCGGVGKLRGSWSPLLLCFGGGGTRAGLSAMHACAVLLALWLGRQEAGG